jgi:hypothetical protein
MARAHLTEIVIRAIQPPLNGQVTYWDTTTRAFGVRLSKGGTRTWVVMRGRTRQLETIGHYPDMPLANARAEAKRRLAERRQPRVSDHSFASALDLFVAMHCAKRNKPSTAKETERLLRKHFLPKFRSRSLADTTHEQIADIIDHITNATANHAFAAIRTFFRWCVRRRFIPHSPCDGMVMPDRPVVRDRVLTDPELVSIWRAAERYGYPFGTIVQLLILTGQRRSEIAMLKWEYINQEHRIITLPSEIVATHFHTVLLSPTFWIAFPAGPDFCSLLAAPTIDRSPDGPAAKPISKPSPQSGRGPCMTFAAHSPPILLH